MSSYLFRPDWVARKCSWARRIPTLPRQRRVLSFGRENCQNWNALLAPLDVVFTVVGFRIEIGGAPADRAQVGIALGEGEIRAAQQRQCNCNHGHDLLHSSLLLFDAACRPHCLKGSSDNGHVGSRAVAVCPGLLWLVRACCCAAYIGAKESSAWPN